MLEITDIKESILGLEVTIVHKPHLFARLLGANEETRVYCGYGKIWMEKSKLGRAPQEIAEFLSDTHEAYIQKMQLR